MSRGPRSGFTLLELSIVLALIGIIVGMGLTTLTASLKTSQYNVTVRRMDEIEKALFNYALANNRIPCPSDLAQVPASATYGFEAGAASGSSPGTGTGVCTGTTMTPQATFKATTGTAEGGVPTRALQLPDDYLYDGWGRRFRYAVDPTYTASAALPAPAGGPCTASTSAIAVNDASGSARTTTAIYVLISHGANGHGTYTSNGVAVNAGSINQGEQANCHCSSTGASSSYPLANYQPSGTATGFTVPTYVEKYPTLNSANSLDTFDDIVTFKEAWQFQAQNYLLAAAQTCTVIYATDNANYRVEIFNMSGGYVGQFGSHGGGNSQFQYIAGVAVDSSGYVWVADAALDVLKKFTSTGTYVSQISIPAAPCARGLTIDSSNNFWVSDDCNNQVYKYSSTGGSPALTLGSGTSGSANTQFTNPLGMAIDSGGNIWVADQSNNRVQEFSGGGTYLKTLSGSAGPLLNGCANPLNGPMGIAIDSIRNIWVTNGGCDVITKYGSGGINPTGYISGSGIVSYQVSDPSGNIWGANLGTNSIEKFSSSGVLQSSYGSSGNGNGQFGTNSPNFIAIGR
jgi:prepilin-type N-terminal cleavage/methylation domain-containing protein